VVKVEIEIPDPPEGWVFDGYRQCMPGELTLRGCVWMRCEVVTVLEYPVAVKAKPLWEPSPELVAVLKPGWIARDRNGFWYWYKGKPMCGTHMWLGDSSRSLNAVRKELLAPATIPWDQSCFKIGEPQE
jgi:hypothetical protein